MQTRVPPSRGTRVALATAAFVLGSAATAAASPLMRFGLTSGVNRNTPEGAEVGPMFAVGASSGRFTGEVHYSYLSFMDPDTGIHRAGVALRSDLTSWGTPRYWKTLFGEVGVAKRWGAWRMGDNIHAESRNQNEVNAAVGLQLDTKWQIALRAGVARLDPMVANLGTSCRGITCAVVMMPGDSANLATSIMLEWMFMLGR